MKPEPPPITIVDPNAPPMGTADLLDSGGDGRSRMTGHQKVVALLVAAIVAVIGGGVAQIRHVHHQRSLDQAALEDVNLRLSAPDDWTEDEPVALTLANDGRLDLRVLSVSLVGEGYDEQPQDIVVLAGSEEPVELDVSRNCQVGLLTHAPEQVRVKVRTTRGQVVSRVLAFTVDGADTVGEAAREACGYLRPEEAIEGSPLRATRKGRDVVVTYELANRGALPVTLVGFAGASGIKASASLPVRLGAKDSGTGSTELTITLHVTSCAAFRGDSEGDVIPLVARVKNAYVGGFAFLDLTDYDGDFEPGEPPKPPDPLDLLAQICS